MGFCLFGNVALAAKHALVHHGLGRVAVVDFDVHHGNGTQDLLWDEPQALFFSSHQSPLWPGTGTEGERGAHDQIVNLPLLPESGGAQMRETYERRVFPMLDAFAPELLLISAGFDADAADRRHRVRALVDKVPRVVDLLRLELALVRGIIDLRRAPLALARERQADATRLRVARGAARKSSDAFIRLLTQVGWAVGPVWAPALAN